MNKKDDSNKIKVEFSPVMSKEMNALQDSVKPISAALSEFSKPIVIQGLNAVKISAKIGESLRALVKSYQSQTYAVTSKVVELLGDLRYNVLSNITSLITSIDFSGIHDSFEKAYFEAMSAAKWFPHECFVSNIDTLNKIIDVLDHTRPTSKNRINLLNKVVFEYFDKKTLNALQSSWKTKDLKVHFKQMMCEAIKAYNCGWYASTVSILVPLWQGLIQQKATGTSESRTDAKTKAELQIIVQDNPHAKIIEAFCDEYIFYTCYSLEQVKDDVPGRHGVCHSWHKEYPTRKTALNAIIFTDFLLSLYPAQNKEENNG